MMKPFEAIQRKQVLMEVFACLKIVRINPVRFVFVSTMFGYSWGGSEELWSRAALRLFENSHQVAASVEFWPDLSTQVTSLAKRGIRLWVRSKLPPRLPVRVWRRITHRKPGDQEWLRRQNPDLVIISQGGNADGLPWMKFCLKAGLPFTAIVQSNSEYWWWGETGAELAEAYCAARKVFCVSRHNLELLERQIGESLPNGTVVWNPYNVSRSQPPASPPKSDVWKLACVGRLDPGAKGQDLLLDVLARPQWRNRAVEVNFYGTGHSEHSLMQLAQRLRLNNVQFRGHIADVKAIWEQNHILVLPSRVEGLPLALVEAMFCARPAVVTDIGGNAELCVDGETGFVAAAPAVSILEHTLERAWNQRHEWQRMGTAARTRAERLIPNDPIGEFCSEILQCTPSGPNSIQAALRDRMKQQRS
jgi:glycosyltransferase involved in cell wall biosynthesis